MNASHDSNGAGEPAVARVVASYDGVHTAMAMAERLRAEGIPVDALRVDHLEDIARIGRAEQRMEAGGASVAVGALGRGDQVMPGWCWATVGFIVGTLMISPVAFLLSLDDDLSRLASVLLVLVCGGLGGATVGLVYGLSRGPDLHGTDRDAPSTSVLGVEEQALKRRPRARELLHSEAGSRVLAADDPARVDPLH